MLEKKPKWQKKNLSKMPESGIFAIFATFTHRWHQSQYCVLNAHDSLVILVCTCWIGFHAVLGLGYLVSLYCYTINAFEMTTYYTRWSWL